MFIKKIVLMSFGFVALLESTALASNSSGFTSEDGVFFSEVLCEGFLKRKEQSIPVRPEAVDLEKKAIEASKSKRSREYVEELNAIASNTVLLPQNPTVEKKARFVAAEKYHIERLHDQDTAAMLVKVKEILALGCVEANEILVVSDVDGVLLQGAQPDDRVLAVAKNGALYAVSQLKSLGVSFIASSAWNNPKSTTRRLREAGFGELLNLGDADHMDTVNPYEDTIAGQKCSVAHTGLMASVRRKNHGDKTYYRAKALSPEIILGKGQSKNFKVVLFADDSSNNIVYFQQDLAYESYSPHCRFILMGIK